MPEPTLQQRAAIEREGRVIVSASAGSGKTFVMIERLVRYIEGGGDLDEVLAVTFTKKAAAQMKDKLRSALIKRAASADGEKRARLKEQLAKIPLANISTIHSFCAYLLRVYFYMLDIDGSFEIVSEDGGSEARLRARALDGLFTRLYESGDEDFLYLLERYGRKRGDGNLRALVLSAFDCARNLPDYERLLGQVAGADEAAFDAICASLLDDACAVCGELEAETEDFCSENALDPACRKIAGEMLGILRAARERSDLFEPLPKFTTSRKPSGSDKEPVARAFFELRDYVKGRYEKLGEGLGSREEELAAYLSTDRTARAFSELVLKFGEEYSAVKRDEGKLDYGDLEHLTLRLLGIDGMRGEICSRFKRVFVDEYQDVNPVQERIISLIGGDVFLVGDVKQAIYGFRGSKSEYFSRKAEEFSAFGGSLTLPHNFRSAPAVVAAVNACFSSLMREETCGIDYKNDSVMIAGGGYPEGSGGAVVHLFGREEKSKTRAEGVYSPERDELKRASFSREGLAVLDVVQRELSSTIYDPDSGGTRPVEPGDICILTRKRGNDSAAGIVRALTAAGFGVSGGQGGNACEFPEVRQMLDVLSYIDNGEQDIPLAAAMLSPVGGFSEEELALVRIRFKEQKELPFRECCLAYSALSDGIASKIRRFYENIERYRTLAGLFGAGTLIDAILKDTSLEAKYSRGGGKKLKNIRRLAEAAYTSSGELPLGRFLLKIKEGGYDLPLAESGGEESISVMTMHSSKGLEFPVVIIADVACPWRGRSERALPFDGRFGFAHKMFDVSTRVAVPTVLGRLIKQRAAREEVRGEMNLLYVACTRAKYRLHIMSSKEGKFNKFRVASAADYASMLDFSCFAREDMSGSGASFEQPAPVLVSEPDGEAAEAFAAQLMRPYAYAESIGLDVKSSATALLKAAPSDEYYACEELFPEEPDDDPAARGTAYHRFLQLCDFSVKDAEGIAAELARMVREGAMTAEEAGRLDVRSLEEILGMSCFKRASGAELYREREFLCALPACSFLNTSARDDVLVQGAIDLLCRQGDRYAVIDYKYSRLTAGSLVKKYSPQLRLYRLAVEKILGVPAGEIEAYIVNIRTLKEVKLN